MGDAPEAPLNGLSFLLLGRLDHLPATRLERELRQRGAILARRQGEHPTHLIIGHGAAPQLRSGALERAVARQQGEGRAVLSEEGFLRLLSLRPPIADEPRTITRAELLRLARLDETQLRTLELFDVITGDDGRYSFANLQAARHVGTLLRQGATLDGLIQAVAAIRRASQPVELTALTAVGDGVLPRVGPYLAEPSGQVRLAVPEAPTADEIFAAAEQAEAADDLERAAALYRSCVQIEPRDTVARFNLAHALARLGRTAEAHIQYDRVLRLDPGFAEAWYNLAHLALGAGRKDEAETMLRRAILAAPDYPDPHYQLAYLLIDARRPDEAMPLLERFLELDRGSPAAGSARHALELWKVGRRWWERAAGSQAPSSG
jgi:tetratricopeptide (TPR) repeat protein